MLTQAVAMYKLDLPIDTREANAIAARQQREEQRKTQIFNARTRLIGVDTDSLSKQIEEKKLMQQAERERANAYDNDMIKTAQICTLLDERQSNDTRTLNGQLNKFRCGTQFKIVSIDYSKN